VRVEEMVQFEDAAPDSIEPFPGAPDEGFPGVAAASERDAIADATLEALGRRFTHAAIFSSRSDGVSGWVAAGDSVDPSGVRNFSASWTEPSVFLNARLSRTFYLGPLPSFPRHDRLAAALGGWPGECVVQPVFIGERPVAFLLVTAPHPGAVTAEDLGYLRDLSDAASSAFENAIRLKKREI
jgi:GAF domain-containing protein